MGLDEVEFVADSERDDLVDEVAILVVCDDHRGVQQVGGGAWHAATRAIQDLSCRVGDDADVASRRFEAELHHRFGLSVAGAITRFRSAHDA